MITKQPSFAIVGAGIVGASVAYHLVRQGARVTLLDTATRPAHEATGHSFGWLTIGHNASESYTNLRQAALAEWHRVETELIGQLPINWSGALTWRDDPAQTERLAQELSRIDHQVRLVGQAELGQLEPNLIQVPPMAILAPNEGAVDSILATNLFVTAARQAGATVQLGHEVVKVMTNGSRVTGLVTARGQVAADVVVLASGIQATALCQPLGVALPITISPSLLMTFRQEQAFVNHVISTPCMDLRAASASLSLAVADYVDEPTKNNPAVIGQRTLKKLQAHWQGTEHLELAHTGVGQRPIPADGLPLIGRLTPIEGLYISVMHAGVTLAALVGRLVAREVIDDEDNRLLLPYRPGRY